MQSPWTFGSMDAPPMRTLPAPYAASMTRPPPGVSATVTEQATGKELLRLGAFATAAVARSACVVEAGEPLTWTPDGVAHLNGREYRVSSALTPDR